MSPQFKEFKQYEATDCEVSKAQTAFISVDKIVKIVEETADSSTYNAIIGKIESLMNEQQ